jgi:hypothetical protein
MAVDTSDVYACTSSDVMKFTNIGTTNSTVSTTIDESMSFASVIMQRYMVTNVGDIKAVHGG